VTATGRRPRSCRFGPLTVEYDERVLVPRPWTELQSRWAAELAARAEPGPILELCAGAGHIGLLAAVLTGRDLVQVEAEPVAAAYAVANARRAGVGERVEVRAEALQSALCPDERFPLIIADPPYLPSADVARWPEDPHSAIDGGADGMALSVDCLRVAARQLTAAGQLLLQVAGSAQDELVAAELDATPALGLARREIRVVDEARAVVRITRSQR
jgi:methylase of polypeptide subunit release factors